MSRSVPKPQRPAAEKFPKSSLIGNSMCAPMLDSPPGPAADQPPPPPFPVRDRAVIALHTTIVAVAAIGYIVTSAITGSWEPHPWPAGLMALYFAGMAGITGYAVWRGVTGRAIIDTESLGAIKSRCINEATRRPGPACAVAMRSVLPHPFSGYVYAAITAERQEPNAAGQTNVHLRQTPGWALTRRTAWHRGLTLTGHDTDPDATSGRNLGPLADAPTPHPALTHHGCLPAHDPSSAVLHTTR